MNSLELTSAVTALANAIVCKLTPSEIALTASIFVQLGDTLATIEHLRVAVVFVVHSAKIRICVQHRLLRFKAIILDKLARHANPRTVLEGAKLRLGIRHSKAILGIPRFAHTFLSTVILECRSIFICSPNSYLFILSTISHGFAVISTHAGRNPLLMALRTDFTLLQAAQ